MLLSNNKKKKKGSTSSTSSSLLLKKSSKKPSLLKDTLLFVVLLTIHHKKLNIIMENPIKQNLIATLATIVYVKVVVGVCDILVDKNLLPSKVSRKVIHISAGSWIIFWNLFTQEHWTWKFNIMVPAIYSVQLFVQGAIIQNPNDTDVKTMTRTGNPIELLFGPLMFTLIMNIVGTFFFKQEIGICIMSCLGYGDGIAPLIGTYYPYGKYKTYPFVGGSQNDNNKTLSGSLGFFFGSIFGYIILKSIIILDDENVATTRTAIEDIIKFIPIATMATITEGITGQWDNICVPVIVYYLYNYYYYYDQ